MTAIDELCRILAKMGVEYVLDEEYGKKYPPEQRVTWSCDIAGEDMTVTARDYCIGRDESGEWEYCLDLEFHEVFTPEQAIAATVGRGTCHMEFVAIDASVGYPNLFLCSECKQFAWVKDSNTLHYCPNCGRKVVNE